MNKNLKPKDVSDAYALIALITDPAACKERLDEITLAYDTAVKEQARAAEDKRYALAEMENMTKTLSVLRAESNELHADKELYEVNVDDLNNKIKRHRDEVALKDAEYSKKNLELASREQHAALVEADAKELMNKANTLMDQAKAMQSQYEGKLKKLKELA
jgi:chromosome segregation ATPase